MGNNLIVDHVGSFVHVAWTNGSPILRLTPEDALDLAEELTRQADKILSTGVPPIQDNE